MNSLDSNPYGLRDNELSSGTTIMAVTFDGGVVLGADSRVTSGSYIVNRTADKIQPVHDYVWACRSGSAADTQAISDYVRYYVDSHVTSLGRLPKVKTCATLMSHICYGNKDNLMAGMICAGWDPYDGGQVYEVPIGGTLLKQDFSIGGSGSTYIYGLVDSLYKPGMTKEECQDFVKKCVSHAMARDGSSGGVVRIVTVDQTGVKKECLLGNDLPYLP
mmetsp:Transcript_19741/g.19854  ORF Transcript_19741/g.19854 Transcript_19741/m.19854 type:complete len:218 (+) Transcript_19741:113-766(+)|eukprot:CAMPEP_0182427502 /NCGR_PEP_ID=MMETSP1167-20130531/17936_1 /TAXON_ID=2988 /ORGANISM="Mallomonas Sp, Strain CCMP3275" /LENGTH=217 /DNA_ID=CAMNT_0024609791 /DNA_START=106 /DNA_END=759 /DNA_ORIENTATION=+